MEAFLADPAHIGQRYLGRYGVWTTSGITSRRGIVVHDDDALIVFTALLVARTSRRMRSLLRGGRMVALVVPGGHFTLTAFLEHIRSQYPIVADAIRLFSALSPLVLATWDIRSKKSDTDSSNSSFSSPSTYQAVGKKVFLMAVYFLVIGTDIQVASTGELSLSAVIFLNHAACLLR